MPCGGSIEPQAGSRAAGSPMSFDDLLGLTLEALRMHKLRYGLSEGSRQSRTGRFPPLLFRYLKSV